MTGLPHPDTQLRGTEKIYLMVEEMSKEIDAIRQEINNRKRTSIFFKKNKSETGILRIKVSMDKLGSWLSRDGEKNSEWKIMGGKHKEGRM